MKYNANGQFIIITGEFFTQSYIINGCDLVVMAQATVNEKRKTSVEKFHVEWIIKCDKSYKVSNLFNVISRSVS